MNIIGSQIWKLIESPIKVMDLVKKLLKEFDVDEDICKKDVLSFLSTMYNKDVIKVT